MSNYFKIPASNLNLVEAKIAKFNKKAAKLNAPQVEIIIHGREVVEVERNDFNESVYREYANIEVLGENPVISGYRMLAAVDHEGGVNIIRCFPGVEEVPVEYRTRKPFCDHCSTHRIKKCSIIIQNVEDGSTMQVGKNCLKDFFDYDVTTHLARFEFIRSLEIALANEDSEYFQGGETVFEIEQLLTISFCAIRQWGFHKSDADKPTKGDVIEYLLTKDRKVRARYEITDADRANSKASLEWLAEQDASSDFIHNLQAMAALGGVGRMYVGYIAGMAASYLRSLEQKKLAEGFADEYVGEIKKRGTYAVKLLSIKTIEGYYGYTHIHRFVDSYNHLMVWFASKDDGMEVDCEYKVKATVKKHDEYQGTKQTIITRVAVQ